MENDVTSNNQLSNKDTAVTSHFASNGVKDEHDIMNQKPTNEVKDTPNRNEDLNHGENKWSSPIRNISYDTKQAGTGPSRRHIQGSKIAKRLPSVKYSLLQYSKIENFSKKIFSKKIHT